MAGVHLGERYVTLQDIGVRARFRASTKVCKRSAHPRPTATTANMEAGLGAPERDELQRAYASSGEGLLFERTTLHAPSLPLRRQVAAGGVVPGT